jgi:hypothetical protein
MPFCPRCRAEYRPGFSRCADCEVDLVAERPPPPAPPRWVEVFRGEFAQADVLRGALEAAGIETAAPDEMISNLGWNAPGSFTAVRVFVPETRQAEAFEILAGLHRLKADPPDDGPEKP